MNADFFPKLPGRYAEPVRLAFLVSPFRAKREQFASSVATITTTTRPDPSYFTALFTEEAPAYQWLAC
jgi:hypothetical protein